jgi:hypothetical protein
VATPWVAPRAVAFTTEQCRAWAGWGAILKATIAQTPKAASSNLVMALSSLGVVFSQLNIYHIYFPSSHGSLVKVICSLEKANENVALRDSHSLSRGN